MKTKLVLGLTVLALSFGAGRWSKRLPTPVAVKESTKESDQKTWQSEASSSASSETKSENSQQTNRTEEWYRPDGTLARRLVLGEVSLSRSQVNAAASASRSEAASRTVTREVTREVRYDASRWHLDLGVYQDVGAALGRTLQPSLGVGLTYRLVGPLAAFGSVTAPIRDWRGIRASVGLGLAFRF